MLRALLTLPLAFGLMRLGQTSVPAFAALAALAAFWVSVTLERQRLNHEYPFYFNSPAGKLGMAYMTVTAGVAIILKTILTGGLAFLFFSGTAVKESAHRIEVTSLAFGGCLAAGALLIALLHIRNPAVRRWGYFRLVLPLGLLYSTLIHLWPKQSSFWFWDNVSARNCLNPKNYAAPGNAADCYFEVSQSIDQIIETLLANMEIPLIGTKLPAFLVQAVSVLGSSNLAMGFVIAPLAVLLLDLVSLGKRRAVMA